MKEKRGVRQDERKGLLTTIPRMQHTPLFILGKHTQNFNEAIKEKKEKHQENKLLTAP